MSSSASCASSSASSSASASQHAQQRPVALKRPPLKRSSPAKQSVPILASNTQAIAFERELQNLLEAEYRDDIQDYMYDMEVCFSRAREKGGADFEIL